MCAARFRSLVKVSGTSVICPEILLTISPNCSIPKPRDVLAARDRVLVRAAASVHQLAADLGDAVLVQAANRELEAEPRIDPRRVDHQVPHAVGEAVDRDLGPYQQEAEGSTVLLGDILAREGAERVAPVRRSGGDGAGNEQSADSVLVNRTASEPVPIQIAGEDEGGEVLLRGRSAAAKPVKRSLARCRCFLGGDLIAAVLRDGHVVSVSPMYRTARDARREHSRLCEHCR